MIKKFKNKILLVDDDVHNLQVAMTILKDYNVIYAQNGKKALDLLEKNQFDLILLDVVMPDMDGYDVCKIIKNKNELKKIPIIFLTVKDEEKDIVKGFELGAVDYVIKPFFSEVLLKRVELHLKLASVMNELKEVNLNLNNIVDEQIDQIRQKDKLIIQESKIDAISDIIDVLSLQFKIPIDKIKLYIQSLNFKLSNVREVVLDDVLDNTFQEINKLDEIMNDFHKFFYHQENKELVNIKVSIDNSIFLLKDKIEKEKISINIDGDNLITLDIVYDEIKHIFNKLINKSIIDFKNSDKKDKKNINISIENKKDSICINYEDNAKTYTQKMIDNLFTVPTSKKNTSFDLGFYLIKIFIEKNHGFLDIKPTNYGIKYTINFNKESK